MLYLKNTKFNINGVNGVSSLQSRDIFFFSRLPWKISSLKSNSNSLIKGSYTLSERLTLYPTDIGRHCHQDGAQTSLLYIVPRCQIFPTIRPDYKGSPQTNSGRRHCWRYIH